MTLTGRVGQSCARSCAAAANGANARRTSARAKQRRRHAGTIAMQENTPIGSSEKARSGYRVGLNVIAGVVLQGRVSNPPLQGGEVSRRAVHVRNRNHSSRCRSLALSYGLSLEDARLVGGLSLLQQPGILRGCR